MNDCAIQLHEDYVRYCLERHVLPQDLTRFLLSVLARNKQAILIIGTNGIMLSNVELKRRRSRPLVDVTMELIYEVYVRFCEAYDENIADFETFATFQRSGDLVVIRSNSVVWVTDSSNTRH